MPGRIRSIKPEILEDSKSAGLSHLEWRLFVSSWLIADDHGNLRADVAYVRGATLWALDESRESVANALETLARLSLLSLYEVAGQLYAHITNWDKHQRIDHKGKPRLPLPTDAEASGIASLQVFRETLARPSRGSAETLAPDLRSPISDQDHDPDPRPARTPRARVGLVSVWSDTEREAVQRVLESLTQYSGVTYQLERNGRPTSNAKLVLDRLRDGVSETELRAINGFCAYPSGMGWRDKPDMRRYLRPETLYGPKTHGKYLDDARAWYRAQFGEDAA